eukprot:292385_1
MIHITEDITFSAISVVASCMRVLGIFFVKQCVLTALDGELSVFITTKPWLKWTANDSVQKSIKQQITSSEHVDTYTKKKEIEMVDIEDVEDENEYKPKQYDVDNKENKKTLEIIDIDCQKMKHTESSSSSDEDGQEKEQNGLDAYGLD